MCIFCIPDKIDKTSIDFAKAMHEKYYLPLIALVEEMDTLRKTYKDKTDYHNEAELPKLLEANYLPKFKDMVLSFALENISKEDSVTVAALKAMVENAYRRTQKYVDWKDINLPCVNKEQPYIKLLGLVLVIILIARFFTKTFIPSLQQALILLP